MASAESQVERATERSGAIARWDPLFWGALLVLALSAAATQLARPLMNERLSEVGADAADAMAVVVWLAVLLSPVFFAVVALLFASILWALGTLMEQPTSYRRLLAVTAWSEVGRAVVPVLALSAARVGAIPLSTVSRMLGVTPPLEQQAGMVDAMVAGATSPALVVWVVILVLMLWRAGGWKAWGAVLGGGVVFWLRLLAAAIRQSQMGV